MVLLTSIENIYISMFLSCMTQGIQLIKVYQHQIDLLHAYFSIILLQRRKICSKYSSGYPFQLLFRYARNYEKAVRSWQIVHVGIRILLDAVNNSSKISEQFLQEAMAYCPPSVSQRPLVIRVYRLTNMKEQVTKTFGADGRGLVPNMFHRRLHRSRKIF